MLGEHQPTTPQIEQLTLDVPPEFLGRVAIRPSLESVIQELDAQVATGLRRTQNEAAQGTLFVA